MNFLARSIGTNYILKKLSIGLSKSDNKISSKKKKTSKKKRRKKRNRESMDDNSDLLSPEPSTKRVKCNQTTPNIQ